MSCEISPMRLSPMSGHVRRRQSSIRPAPPTAADRRVPAAARGGGRRITASRHGCEEALRVRPQGSRPPARKGRCPWSPCAAPASCRSIGLADTVGNTWSEPFPCSAILQPLPSPPTTPLLPPTHPTCGFGESGVRRQRSSSRRRTAGGRRRTCRGGRPSGGRRRRGACGRWRMRSRPGGGCRRCRGGRRAGR